VDALTDDRLIAFLLGQADLLDAEIRANPEAMARLHLLSEELRGLREQLPIEPDPRLIEQTLERIFASRKVERHVVKLRRWVPVVSALAAASIILIVSRHISIERPVTTLTTTLPESMQAIPEQSATIELPNNDKSAIGMIGKKDERKESEADEAIKPAFAAKTAAKSSASPPAALQLPNLSQFHTQDLGGEAAADAAVSASTSSKSRSADQPAEAEVRPRKALTRVRIERIETTGIGLPQEIRKRLNRQQAGWRRCLGAQPGESITVVAVIDRAGRVATVQTSGNKITHQDLERCVDKLMRAMTFPQPDGAEQGELRFQLKSVDQPSD